MKNTFTLLAATAAVTLASASFAAEEKANTEVEYKNNGGYEATRNAQTTTPGGTTVSSQSKVDVDVDSKGNVTRSVSTQNATDPKGMLNKQADNGKTVFEEKANGGYKQTTERSHTDQQGTDITLKTVTDVDVDKKGNVITTAKTEKTVDPSGLFNSRTETSTSRSVNGVVVDQKKKVE